jgi:hypothetical protein
MTNLTPAFFFPPYLFLIALGNGVMVKNLYFLACLLTAAWCTWRLLCNAGLSWSASFVGGLTFLMSGGLAQTVGSFIGQTACCLPVGLLATQWFLRQPSWGAAGWLALAFSSIALASFPPILAAVFGLSFLYGCVELRTGGGSVMQRPLRALQFLSAWGLGAGLVAFYYLPYTAMMGFTTHVAAFYLDASSHTPVQPKDILQLLAPALMGGVPVWANDPVPRYTAGTFHYVGAIPLLLVALVGFKHLRKPVWFVAGSGIIVSFGLMFGIAPFDHIRALPILRNIHFGNYYGIVIDFLFSLLAGAGFERLRNGRISALRGWFAVAVVLTGVLAIVLVAFGLKIASHPAYGDWLQRYVVLTGVAFVGATIVFLAISNAGRPSHQYGCAAAVVVLLLGEGGFNSHFPRQARWDAWAHPPPYVEYLQHIAGLDRVFSLSNRPYANSGSAYGIIQLDSLMAFNAPRMFEIYRRYANPTTGLFLRDATIVPPESVLDASNASLVVVPNVKTTVDEITARGHKQVFVDDLVAIFRRSGPPRYFFTSDFEISSEHDALDAVGRSRPRGRIILEQQPPFLPRSGFSLNDVPVKVERFTNNRVVLSLDAPRAGFVYAAESFFPGWRATVNGRDAAIEHANYAFRAVMVPPGQVRLELRYVPPRLWVGIAVSASALVTVLGIVCWGSWRAKRAFDAGHHASKTIETAEMDTPH